MVTPLETSDRLILYLDIKSPYAFLAKDPAKKLESDFDVRIDWRPLTLDIPSFLGSAKVNAKCEVVEENRTPRQWQAVRYAYHDTKRYARLKAISIYGPRKIWDTSLVHQGWLYAKRQSRDIMMQYLDEAFELFWKRDINVENKVDIAALLDHAGADTKNFDSYLRDEGKVELEELQSELLNAGIFGVPTFVVDSEIYFGREHLPTIYWILGGRRGAQPDIAYRGSHSAQ